MYDHICTWCQRVYTQRVSAHTGVNATYLWSCLRVYFNRDQAYVHTKAQSCLHVYGLVFVLRAWAFVNQLVFACACAQMLLYHFWMVYVRVCRCCYFGGAFSGTCLRVRTPLYIHEAFSIALVTLCVCFACNVVHVCDERVGWVLPFTFTLCAPPVPTRISWHYYLAYVLLFLIATMNTQTLCPPLCPRTYLSVAHTCLKMYVYYTHTQTVMTL